MKRLAAFVLLLSFSLVNAQDSRELATEGQKSPRLKGEHPLVELMRTRTSSLKKDLEGVHPRVFVTQSEIDALRQKTRTQPELWQTALKHVRALSVEPPPPKLIALQPVAVAKAAYANVDIFCCSRIAETVTWAFRTLLIVPSEVISHFCTTAVVADGYDVKLCIASSFAYGA